jgi:hypothetical protein
MARNHASLEGQLMLILSCNATSGSYPALYDHATEFFVLSPNESRFNSGGYSTIQHTTP